MARLEHGRVDVYVIDDVLGLVPPACRHVSSLLGGCHAARALVSRPTRLTGSLVAL